MTDNQSMRDAILGIPSEFVNSYFPFQEAELYQSATDEFIKKVNAFGENFTSCRVPFSGRFFLGKYTFLCERLPRFVCSLVYIGKDSINEITPRIKTNPVDITPNWSECSFQTVVEAEQLYQSIVENLHQCFVADDQMQHQYGELKPKIERLKPTRMYDDIRGIYGMLYVELRTFLHFLFPDLEEGWYFKKSQIDNFNTWLALRPYHFPMLSGLRNMSSEEYFQGKYKEAGSKALEDLGKHLTELVKWSQGTLDTRQQANSLTSAQPSKSRRQHKRYPPSTIQIAQSRKSPKGIAEQPGPYDHYAQIELIKRPVSGDSSGGKKHKNKIVLQKADGDVIREYISDNHFSLLYLLAILPHVGEQNSALERDEVPGVLIQTLTASLGYRIGHTWTINTAQLSTVISGINRKFPNLITVEDNDQTGKREYFLNVSKIVPVPIEMPTIE